MPLDRKDLLAAAEERALKTPQPKLTQKVDEGGVFISLKDHPGWRKLVSEYIEPKLKIDSMLAASEEELPLVRARMKVLKELVDFVDKKVEDALKAFETLQKTREDKR